MSIWVNIAALLFIGFVASTISFSAIKQEKKKAARVLKRRTALIHAASHELRIPLTNILGLIAKLKKEEIQTTQRSNTLENLSSEGGALHNMLIDVLEIFELADNTLDVSLKSFCLSEVIEDLVSYLEKSYRDAGLNITIDCPVDKNVWIHSDPVRLRQCLRVLIDEAAYQTKDGVVSVTLQWKAIGKKNRIALRFIVSETSSTLTQAQASKYFIPEAYDSNPNIKGRPAAMLGMNLAQGVAHLLEGSLKAKADENSGISFYLTIKAIRVAAEKTKSITIPEEIVEVAPPEEKPASVAIANTQPSNQETTFSNANVLLVDDNDTNLMVLESLLEPLAFKGISCVGGGKDAVEMARIQDYDLILMDIQMPDLDGLSATRIIRQIDDHYANVPILAVSASNRVYNEKICTKAGMDDFIEKPVDEEKLFAAIRRQKDRIQGTNQKNAA